MADLEHRSELERRAEAKIEAGELPAAFRGSTRAGGGSGEPCDLCGQTVEKSGIEYEVEWQKEAAVRVLRFHLECFQAWVCSHQELVG
jgi:DNA repair exonuclease SbcCD ATPase subunit